jgi:hypothetical protein
MNKNNANYYYKKQICYPSFFIKTLATTIDTFIIAVLLKPLLDLIQSLLMYNLLEAECIKHGLTPYNANQLIAIYTNSINHLAPETNGWVIEKMFLISFCSFITQFFIVGGILCFFWYKFGTTIGKRIFGIYVVDSTTYQRASLIQCITRFFAGFFYVIGVWFACFNFKSQTLHDIIAKTVQIKK